MFTGLVAEIGRIDSIERSAAGARLRVATALAGDARPGDSIAVDGVCLTAIEPGRDGFAADVMNATLERTTLGGMEAGDPVNLELALRAGDRLGGHHVQGHVDGVGTVGELAEDGIATRLRIELPAELRRYVAERGSVAVSGVSLTVSSVTPAGFEVSLIPETKERTTLGGLAAGDQVNIEVDVLARYAERIIQA
jgi:riboflavin synthase